VHTFTELSPGRTCIVEHIEYQHRSGSSLILFFLFSFTLCISLSLSLSLCFRASVSLHLASCTIRLFWMVDMARFQQPLPLRQLHVPEVRH
jgi:hypothetical protein